MEASTVLSNGSPAHAKIIDTDSIKLLLKGPAMARLTIPSDANVYGNVHGGTILKLMEEAGSISATRYCNNATTLAEPCIAVLVRIERMDFLLPMMIGEVAELSAEIVYTAAHSLLVEICVQAENILKGTKRKTNHGRFWYVPISQGDTVQPVPPMIYDDPAKEALGKIAYDEQKAERLKNSLIESSSVTDNSLLSDELTPETVSYSRTCLSFLVGHNDVSLNKICRGGVLLKLMDECAGITSAKHCRTNVVTACLHATNFHRMIKIGSLVTVRGHVTFTSPRSLEVQVIVEYEVPFERGLVKQRAVDAFFTYVSIDKSGKAQPVPPLKIQNDKEQEEFNSGQTRYELRKQKQAQIACTLRDRK